MKTNTFRTLTGNEIDLLKQQGNYAEDWTMVQVCDPFDASLLRNNTFSGHVNIGSLQKDCHTDGDLQLPGVQFIRNRRQRSEKIVRPFPE